MSGKPALSLSAWLALLVIGTVAPLLLFAGATLFKISNDAQDARDQGQTDTARALALAVDGEVRSWKTALTALAASRSIRPDRLAEFDAEARQVAEQHEGWIVLTESSGQQLINTLRPYGTPLPKTSSPETINAIFASGKPLVSDVFYGNVAQGYLVAVAVPVVRGGKVVNCLTLNFYPQRLTRLLEQQQVPSSWIAAINDRQYHVVARSRDIEKRVGKPVVPWLAAAEAAAAQGTATGPLVDGRPGQVAFQRLQEVPWVVTLAVPVAELPSSRPLVLFILGGVVVGVGAVGVALYTGRRITAPVVRLEQASERLLRGEPSDLGPPADIREVQELQKALGEASAAVQGYYQERERAAVAVETAKVATAAEQALRQAHAELEQRVQERTAELSQAVVALKEEMTRRTEAEQILRKQADQLRMLASELTLAEQRERQRLATVLHDEHQQLLVGAKLRMGSLERVQDPTLREEIQEVTALLEEAIENARSLTRELSPPILQAGGLIPALDWLARWMEEKHYLQVDVRTEADAVPDSEELTILLFQAVRELLFNIVKHAKVQTARVELTRQDGQVAICVTDTGVGFDPSVLWAEGGVVAGFGLFSIRQRLELLGGRLDIASALGQGSRITLRAPLRQTGAPTLQAPEKTERPEGAPMTVGSPPASGQTGRIRVLVVDDHKVVRQGLARLLAAEPDIEIVGEAADGKMAVELTRQLGPDVVLMDISMPVMNGIEATRAIRAEYPAVRVIGLSMFEEVEQAQAMRDAGAVAYLSKSGAADALVAAVRACVESGA